MGLLEAVEAEVRLWVHEVLSVPDGYFAGMAPCPYARSAVLKNLVTVEVVDSHERAAEHKLKFDPASEAVIVICFMDVHKVTPEGLQNYLNEQNKQHHGVWMMGFHPLGDEHPIETEIESSVGDYGVILVQSLDHLTQASDQLSKTEYYTNFSDADLSYISARKEQANDGYA